MVVSSRCLNCEYDLTGLPRQARCPECGIEFDLDDKASRFERPRYGYGLLLIPALIVPPTFFLSYLTLKVGGLVILVFVPIVLLATAAFNASEVAHWCVARIRLKDDRVRSYGMAFLWRLLIFLMAQFVFALAAYVGSIWLLDWLISVGVVADIFPWP